MDHKINHKRWAIVFRALANPNRLKIIEMLKGGRKMHVTAIADALSISFTATSNHLALLKNLNVIWARGAAGHVFYSRHPELPEDFQKILDRLLV